MEISRDIELLFKRKRWWLTLTYASVMGCTLGLMGYTFDRIVTNLRFQAVEKEISSLANNIHDNVEHKLARPGRIPAFLYTEIPDLCPIYTNCQTKWEEKHRLSVLDPKKYYANFIDVWGKPKATVGIYPNMPTVSLTSLENLRWDYLHDQSGNNYQQLTLEIHTPDDKVWGYLRVGRSLSDVEEYLDTVRLFCNHSSINEGMGVLGLELL